MDSFLGSTLQAPTLVNSFNKILGSKYIILFAPMKNRSYAWHCKLRKISLKMGGDIF